MDTLDSTNSGSVVFFLPGDDACEKDLHRGLPKGIPSLDRGSHSCDRIHVQCHRYTRGAYLADD